MQKKIYILIVLAGLLFSAAGASAADTEQGQINIRATVLGHIDDVIDAVLPPGYPASFSPINFGTPPMVINGGEDKTALLWVKIDFQVQNAYQMQISNSGDFSGAGWVDFKSSTQWLLPAGSGQKTVYARFRTLNGISSRVATADIALDTTPPANISEFQSSASGQKILLGWKNPPDADFNGVLIVRKLGFYPVNRNDGVAVYNGRGESFADSDLVSGTSYYYAAFTYDDLGNYSSGAVIGVALASAAAVPEITAAPSVPSEIQKIDLSYFEFIQGGKRLDSVGGSVAVDHSRQFTISIPYGKVSEVLKTIMVTLKDGNKIFSFLLRVNKDKTAYEATMVPPDTGTYSFDIVVLDYKNQAFKKISGSLDVIKTDVSESQANVSFTKYIIIRKIPPVIYIILAVLAIWLVRKTYKNSKREKIKKKAD